MDPFEILGSLLGQKAGGSGTGADILRDILTGGPRREAPPRSSPKVSGEPSGEDIERQARELEDLLNVASDRNTRRTTPQTQPQQPTGSRQPAGSAPRQSGKGLDSPVERPFDSRSDDIDQRQNEQATILVRAMVNAAKSDGQLSQAEQQKILSQLENPSPATMQFLREEFARPLDVREFAWSVPVGMEQQVYSMSLIAIDVDSAREEGYLRELAHGLRLKPEVCEQIKERLTGAGSRLAAAR